MPALSKVCPQCSSVEHCRRRVCGQCGHCFQSARRNEKEAMRKRRASEDTETICARRDKDKLYKRKKRMCESELETSERRALDKMTRNKKRAFETEHETRERRDKVKKGMSRKRACESEHETSERRDKVKKGMSRKRACESEHETSERRNKVKEAVSRKRACETEHQASERRTRSRQIMGQFRAKSELVEDVICKFQNAVKLGPEFVCTCCHRMMYRQNVVLFKPTRYTKASSVLLEKLANFSYLSFDGNKWVCRTCDCTLLRGLLPVQSKANGMDLDNVPPELSCLNPLELRLVSLRVPFMKMVALPSGKQKCIHGPAVNVPSNVDKVCTMLPRLPSQCDLVPLKLKRKLSYKGHYMYDYVSSEKLSNALKYLKANNPLYSGVSIDDDWLDNSLAADPELTTSILEQLDCSSVDPDSDKLHSSSVDPPEPHSSSVDPEQCINVDQSVICGSEPNVCNQVQLCAIMLHDFVKEHGFTVHDVPGDGDCLYSAVACQLENVDKCSLRQIVANYLAEHCNEYSQFMSEPVQSDNGYNADNAPLDDEDEYIMSISDPAVREQLRWEKYLKGVQQNAWGDSIVISALCNVFNISINVFHAQQSGTNIIHITPTFGVSKHEVNIGLIMQYHFVALDYADSAVVPTLQLGNTTTVAPESHSAIESTNASGDLSDETIVEGDEHMLEITGGTHASMLTVENPEQIVNIAPAEGQKPLLIMTDPKFELMCNPDKFCLGKGSFSEQRERKITYRKYFNARLLDIDGRFAKDLDYMFVAQYIVESKQVLDDAHQFVWRQKPSREFTASQVQNKSFLGANVRNDKAYKFLKNVRGSPPYYQRTFYELLAMIRQLGTPTWFFTLSAADMKWPDVIQIIARQYGVSYTDEDVKALSYDEKCTWLRRNPVTAARHFQYRLNMFFNDVLKSNAHPLGEIVDYAIRIEFQARGSPHAHCVLWVKDAPKYDVASNDEVCAFIDKYVSCAIPAEECKLKELVLLLQKHRHSSYCKRNGHCRFNFPHPPSPKTLIAEPCADDESLEKAQNLLTRVRKAIIECDENATMSEILSKADVELDDYIEALGVTANGSVVLLKRDPCEKNINNYNESVMLAWQANMDIQYVLNAYACVMYVASYIMKTDRAMGALLKQVAAEVRTDELTTQLRKIGSVFMNHREVSAQECAYRMLSMPMKQLSRSVVFVDTQAKKDRISVLKSGNLLKQLDDDDTNVFQKSLVDRYQHRPQQISSMCLAEFASTYATKYSSDEDAVSDALPSEETELSTTKITLTGGYGVMCERKKPAVIRFRKYNKDADSSNWHRAKLMLYYPWYDENIDLLGGYDTFAEHYEHVKTVVYENEQKYTQDNVDSMPVDEDARPEHAWCQLAPTTEHSNSNAREQGVETLTEVSQQDLVDNANLMSSNASGLSVRFESAANPQIIAPDEYREFMRGLNDKQRSIVMYHRNWCKKAVKALKRNKPIEPYRIFLSGPGGVGKSHVIKLVQSDTLRLIKQSGSFEPDDVLVLLTAPTGVAAFNVNGMTLHSAFLLGRSKYGGFQPLSHDKVNTLRCRLSKLVLLIIDEVSMVGANMLLEIHKRLQQIKAVLPDVMFGGVSILAVGDLYQLPPVGQSMLFSTVSDSYAQLYRSGSLWVDEFQMVELDEIMRQRGDSAFAELLCRVRTDCCTEEDYALLKSREIKCDDPGYPSEALHVYRLNADVDERNEHMLNKLAKTSTVHNVSSKDAVTGQTRHIDMSSLSTKRTETGGLHGVLKIASGAKVMLTTNVDVSDGLVNGARGEIAHIVTNDNNDVTSVLVNFYDQKVGNKACQTSPYKTSYPSAVPLSKVEVTFLAKGKRGSEITRVQFPLTLAWATTIHKVQGLTLDSIVVDMKGNRFNCGQMYVALSRVKALTGLYILNFNEKAIKKSAQVDDEMTRLRDRLLQPVPLLQLMPNDTHITVALLNVRSIVPKIPDICADPDLCNASILCFCETWLSKTEPSPIINTDHVVLRCDRSLNDNKGGTMISVCSTLQPSMPVTFVSSGIECVTTCVCVGQNRLLVVVIYRSPNVPMSHFTLFLTSVLDHANIQNIPTIILGDVNDDALCTNGSAIETFMLSHGYMQLVKVPTTDRSTLIDHVYFKRPCHDLFVQVRDLYFTDHDAVFCSLPLHLL